MTPEDVTPVGGTAGHVPHPAASEPEGPVTTGTTTHNPQPPVTKPEEPATDVAGHVPQPPGTQPEAPVTEETSHVPQPPVTEPDEPATGVTGHVPQPPDGEAAGELGATSQSSRRNPEEIRQEIEATKDRISDSVEGLAEIKADINYAKSHPKEVVKEKVMGAKDDMMARVTEKKDQFLSKRKAGGTSGDGGAMQTLSKAKDKLAEAYGTLETKLDELLGVKADKKTF